MLGLLEWGLVGLIIFVFVCLLLLPIILTIIVGIGIANWFGFTGIFWWAFVILFFLVVSAILGALTS